MYKILIVDDEQSIRGLITKYASHEGYRADECENGAEAVEMCRDGFYDLVILDVMMPVLDGFAALERIRAFSSVPVIMLSARGEEYDRVRGFELGVDDYVVKPFSPRELMLRVAAVLKRGSGLDLKDGHSVYARSGLSVDFTARTVEVDGVRCDMSLKEYDLLFYLIRNRGIALTRDRLLSEVWGYDFFGDDRTLDTHIKLVRKKLGRFSGCIVTLRGVGYRFEDPKE